MKKSRQKIITLAVLVAIVYGLWGYLFFKVQEQGQQVSELLQEVDFEIKREERVRSMQGLLDQSGDDIFFLKNRFVKNNDVVEFIESIEALAESVGLIPSISSLAEDRVVAVNNSLIMQFGTVGNWQDTYHFLSLLEVLPLKIDISRVDLVRNPEGLWQANFALSALEDK
jgi:hypothetical protein